MADLSLSQTLVYLYFLSLCLTVTYLSARLFINNKMSKDTMTESQMYEKSKSNRFIYYMNILQRKLWIVGLFGIYLSLFVFSSLLEAVIVNMGLTDIDSILSYVNLGLAYGFIPFTIFWLGYIIITFYQSTVNIMKYQFGGDKWRGA